MPNKTIAGRDFHRAARSQPSTRLVRLHLSVSTHDTPDLTSQHLNKVRPAAAFAPIAARAVLRRSFVARRHQDVMAPPVDALLAGLPAAD